MMYIKITLKAIKKEAPPFSLMMTTQLKVMHLQ